jgi:FRG domain
MTNNPHPEPEIKPDLSNNQCRCEVDTIATYLEDIQSWFSKHNINEKQYLSRIWFRGIGKIYPKQLPGVYREDFSNRLEVFNIGRSIEEKRLNLERELLKEFRTSGAMLLRDSSEIDIYLIAQHYGMPTRLLDWTTNPLAALFFAVECENKHNEDGEIILMDASKTLPEVREGADGNIELFDVATTRHPYVKDAIGESFWINPEINRDPIIIPIRPNHHPGRIAQQSSCFTLHMHNASPKINRTLEKIKVNADSKKKILKELNHMNINHFTIYQDLDHLSKDIKRCWSIKFR